MATASQKTVVIDPNTDLEQVLNDYFQILSDKEQRVIIKRFSLDAKPRQTLERIGQHFSVTRERIRQIESIALKKLQRNFSNTQLHKINVLAKQVLDDHGGVMKEEDLLAEILNITHISKTPVTGSIIKLSLTIDSELEKLDTSKVYFPFWRKKEVALQTVEKIASTNYRCLKKQGDLVAEKILLEKIFSTLKTKNIEASPALVVSCLNIDRRFRRMTEGKWGLMEWRHVNPKSIRDKANIILNKANKPLHFIEIANQISQTGFDKKVVTVQAVHNDLIRYPEFVLVGRGMYALSEWGYEPGTVADVIAKILQEKGPLKKKQIVQAVLEQRDVKLGTISLNLQKNPAFIRVGRAVYDFDESGWAPVKRGRGRAKVQD